VTPIWDAKATLTDPVILDGLDLNTCQTRHFSRMRWLSQYSTIPSCRAGISGIRRFKPSASITAGSERHNRSEHALDELVWTRVTILTQNQRFRLAQTLGSRAQLLGPRFIPSTSGNRRKNRFSGRRVRATDDSIPTVTEARPGRFPERYAASRDQHRAP